MSNEIARRDAIVGSTVEAAKAEGRPIDAEKVSREVARNFDIIDRARSIGELRDPSPRDKTAPRPVAERPVNHAASLAQRMGSTTWEASGDGPEETHDALVGNDMLRLIAMRRRIELLMKPVSGYKLKVTRDPATGMVTDCEPLWNACQYPAFANRLATEFACYANRKGTYAGMKYADRWRKHMRAVEDILDRSDAAVGVNWWVK